METRKRLIGIISFESVSFFAALILMLLIQFFAITRLEEKSLFILLSFNAALLIIIYNYAYIKNIYVALILINVLPLIYLNNEFHYSFMGEVLLSFPILILVGLSILKTFRLENILSLNLSYIEYPIILYLCYSLFSAFLGILNGFSSIVVFMELFHALYYGLAIVFLYILKKKEDYSIIGKGLIVLAVFISVEYILYNIMSGNNRFVTFQSGYLPLAAGIIFAIYLMKKKNRMFLSGVLFLIIAGAFVTLTRTLWVTTFISLAGVLFLYLTEKYNLNFRHLLPILLLIILPTIFLLNAGAKKIEASAKQTIETRAQSLTNPTEDQSFLMRVEIGYYVIKKYLGSPFWGTGFGDTVNYHILKDTKANVIYPDSTYLYILWKQGLIGFLLYLLIFYRFIKSAWYVYSFSSNPVVRAINLGIISAMIGFALLNMLSPLFIKYKSNIVLAFLFAYVENEKRLICKEKFGDK